MVMCDLEKILKDADEDKFKEVCSVIDSSIKAGAHISVLADKLREYKHPELLEAV